MQINQIKIYNYGKLQNKEYSFGPGVNLIYGENEAGKSTMQAFLKSMLFGMEKQKGRAAAGELYSKYEPWHAPSYYSGAIRFTVEGKPFYLERNFYVKEKQERLCNEADGEELSIAYGDLAMLLGGMTRAGYENTFEIPQSGAMTGPQMAEILAEYLSDVASSGTSETHVTRALRNLAGKRKELSATLKQEEQKKKQQVEHLLVEQNLLERDIGEQRRLLQQNRELDQENQEKIRRLLEEQKHHEQEMQQKVDRQSRTAKNKKKSTLFEMITAFMDQFPPRILRIAGGALAILNSFAYQIWYQIAPLFWCLEILFILLFFYGIIRGKDEQWEQSNPEEEDEQDERKTTLSHSQIAQELEGTLRQSGKMLTKLEESIREKEVRLSNLNEQLEQLQQLNGKEIELKENIEALELAQNEISRLSKDLCEDIKDELDAEVSRYVSGITAGKYDRIRVDDTGKLQVFADGRTIAPEQLSKGTLEQLYLALRLAVGSVLSREEKLPLLLDETFAMYDQKRLNETLRLLMKLDTQIFLFTCQEREEESLQKMGILYQKVVL